MHDQAAHERALNLAPMGLCECRVCKRVGPLNGAMVSWWAGLPFNAICPDCFSVGRTIIITRHMEGIEARITEQNSAPRVILPVDLGEGDMKQTKLSRSPSEGW